MNNSKHIIFFFGQNSNFILQIHQSYWYHTTSGEIDCIEKLT